MCIFFTHRCTPIDRSQSRLPPTKKGRKQKEIAAEVQDSVTAQVDLFVQQNYLCKVPNNIYGMIFIHAKLFITKYDASHKKFKRWIEQHLAKKGNH
jgi:hypothetical protein